jgi:hypothetical protein
MKTPSHLANTPAHPSPTALEAAVGRGVLLVPDRRYTCDCLAAAMAGPRDHIAIVRDAYDVVLALQASSHSTNVIAAPLADASSGTVALLSFARTQFPAIWRIGYVVDGRDDLERRDPSFGLQDLPAQWAPEVQLVVRLSHRRSCGHLHALPHVGVMSC